MSKDCQQWKRVSKADAYKALESGEEVHAEVEGEFRPLHLWSGSVVYEHPVARVGWPTLYEVPYEREYRVRVDAPTLQIKEGAWYEQRDGKVVGPAKANGGHYPTLYPWVLGGHEYMDGGGYYNIADGSQLDLIKEVPAPVEEPEPGEGYRLCARDEAEEYRVKAKGGAAWNPIWMKINTCTHSAHCDYAYRCTTKEEPEYEDWPIVRNSISFYDEEEDSHWSWDYCAAQRDRFMGFVMSGGKIWDVPWRFSKGRIIYATHVRMRKEEEK